MKKKEVRLGVRLGVKTCAVGIANIFVTGKIYTKNAYVRKLEQNISEGRNPGKQ
jgi:hypothetical protein